MEECLETFKSHSYIESCRLQFEAKRFDSVLESWRECCANTESTLHQLSPYVGKLKSSIAGDLIAEYTDIGDLVVDPFAGSGTVLLEAMLKQRRAFGADISPYASLLCNAKMRPPKTEVEAIEQTKYLLRVADRFPDPDLRKVPVWVRKFFHPETLRECIRFSQACRSYVGTEFVFSCFLGILHHQRPGFLSYPSSHLVPYLRDKKYPRNQYPEMYEYRELAPRLLAKIKRAYKRAPAFKRSLIHGFKHASIEEVTLPRRFQCLITSPPYMNALDYGRDNRLRLWFLDNGCAESIDASQSQRKNGFSNTMEILLRKIDRSLDKNGTAIFIVGESVNRSYAARITDIVKEAASRYCPKLKLDTAFIDQIPDIRRSRKELSGVRDEHFLVYRRRN